MTNGRTHNQELISDLSAKADGIRARVLELSLERGGGYLSQACSSAETFAALYGGIMNLEPLHAPIMAPRFTTVPGRQGEPVDGYIFNGERRPENDRFYLSPSHYCMGLYAALIEFGRLDPASLFDFNRDGATVEMIGAEHSPGMALTTGSFGQGLSQVAGVALARRARGHTGNNWLFMSDGEFNEGQVWEALAFCAKERLDSIGVIVDVNGQQVDGLTKDVFDMGSLADKCRAFEVIVAELDGHDIGALLDAGELLRRGKPVVILAHTDPAGGMDAIASRKPDLHYVGIKSDDERAALRRTLADLRRSAGHKTEGAN